MKRIILDICVIILLINICFVRLQEENENKKWRKSQIKLEKKMLVKELNPIDLNASDLNILNQSIQYKNKLIKNLKHKGQQYDTRNDFTSFLSLNRVWQTQDDPKKFFMEDAYTTNIHSLPTVGRSNIQAWSGSYWPMRNGGISVRYNKNDKNTIGVIDTQTGNFLRYYVWSESVSLYSQPKDHNSFSRNPKFSKFVDDNYSAAEKYDLLVGDDKYTLTNFSKNEGTKYVIGNDVIAWFGICHGWAPASYNFPTPTRSVHLIAQNGMTIRFLPDDIKALASLFWANAKFTTLFVGNRCEYYYPHPGWFSSPNCISLNPASFIIIIANHLGLYGKNLVYEPTADPEIWNLPLRKYEMKYYNVFNNEFSPNAASVKVPISQLKVSSDSFLRYVADSDPKAVYAVGVFVKTTHADMIQLQDLVHDDKTADNKEDHRKYDAVLTLDENDNIIGGEWKYKDHPNFIWRHDPSKPVEGVSDKDFPNFAWTSNIVELARKASNQGQPLKAIVEYLVYNSA